jgi:hypothetical protein
MDGTLLPQGKEQEPQGKTNMHFSEKLKMHRTFQYPINDNM